MFKKIKMHLEYKKKVKILKMVAVNQLTNIIISKHDYLVGFQKLLITMSNNDNAEELQKTLNDYLDVLKATATANKVMDEEK